MVQKQQHNFSVYAETRSDGSCNMACHKMFLSQQDRIDQNQQHIRHNQRWADGNN